MHNIRDQLFRRKIGILFSCTIGNFVSVTPTVTVVLSLFLVPISTEFGWPRATVSGVLALLAIIASLAIPLAGRLADSYGARRIILVGHVAFAVSLPFLALANGTVLQFYLLFGLVGLCGAIPTQSLFSKVISEWFYSNRAFCLSFSGGVGNGIGSIVMPLAAGVMLTAYGWRIAFIGMGALVLIIGFPVLFTLLKDHPKRAPHLATDNKVHGISFKEAAETPLFWTILSAITLGAGSLTALFTHIVPILTDRGFSLTEATATLSLCGLACAGWQIIVGLILDRSNSVRILVPMFLCAIVGLFILQYATSFRLLMLGGALIGIGLGSEYGGLPYLLSRYFGLRAYGTITGVMFGVITLTQGIVPFLFDSAYDHYGSYHISIIAVSACLAVGAALFLTLPSFSNSTLRTAPL